MAMKKKIAAGIGAVLVTAMCFGSTAFAEQQPINGSGNTPTDGTTDVTTKYTKSDDTSWSVNIPKSIDFGNTSVTTPTVTKELEYSAVIGTGTTEIESITVTLPTDTPNDFILKDTNHNLATAKDAYAIKDKSGNDLDNNKTIATLKNGESATAQAVLDVSKITDATASASSVSHGFSGSFKVIITPSKATS